MEDNSGRVLPGQFESEQATLEASVEYFRTKIKTIRAELTAAATSSTESCSMEHRGYIETLGSFSQITEDDLAEIFKSMKKKSSRNDLIPTSVLSRCYESISKYILRIINLSLSTGGFPSQMKHATTTPIIKGKNSDSDDLKNYIPVSNLPFLSKLIQKVVAKEIILPSICQ